MKKILHLNTNDFSGAFKAAYRLHQSLHNHNFESIFMVKAKYSNHNDIIEYSNNSGYWTIDIFTKIKRRIKLIFKKKIESEKKYNMYDLESQKGSVNIQRLVKQSGIKPDIIILYWVSKFLSAKNIYDLEKYTQSKIFWVLMDMAPMTGGCHYAWDCRGYENSCSQCPGILHPKSQIKAEKNLFFKKKWLHQTNYNLIAGSSQLIEQANRSTLFKKRTIHTVMVGLDPDIFKPINQERTREALSISKERKVIFFGAEYDTDERKGFAYLEKSLQILEKTLNENQISQVLLLVAGKNTKKIDTIFSQTHLGYINDEKKLALAYQCADIFVCPSLEDSGPVMVNESIMCGTPVVSFDVGVAKDLVINGKTGFRCYYKDSNEMAQRIKELLDLPKDKYQKVRTACADLGKKHCTLEVQTQGFINLF